MSRTARKMPRKCASKRVTPGSGLQGLVIDYLAARRIRVRRNNVGTAKYGRVYVKYGEPGMADLTAYVPTYHVPRLFADGATCKMFYVLNLEIKAGADRQSYAQKIWQAGVEASGEFYLIVRSLDDVIAWLDAHSC